MLHCLKLLNKRLNHTYFGFDSPGLLLWVYEFFCAGIEEYREILLIGII